MKCLHEKVDPAATVDTEKKIGTTAFATGIFASILILWGETGHPVWPLSFPNDRVSAKYITPGLNLESRMIGNNTCVASVIP